MTTPRVQSQPLSLSLRYNWWFHESPAVLISSFEGNNGQPNKIADSVQLEQDCLVRAEQLSTAHDTMQDYNKVSKGEPVEGLLWPDPPPTAEDILADQLAAFIIHLAHSRCPNSNSRNLIRLETDLFLFRTRDKDPMTLFALFGKTCVPMKKALENAGTWDTDSSRPNPEITSAMEAVMHLSPGHYANQKEGEWWQHFFATTFQTVTPLLSTRKVLLKSGIAYFHANDMQTVFRHLCKTSLQHYMARMKHVLFDFRHEQFAHIARISRQILSRFKPLVMHNTHTLTPALKQHLSIDTIYDTMLEHAPLCIRALLFKLEQEKDGLKNDERSVLRTFLLTCGVEEYVTTELFMRLSGLEGKSFASKYGKDIVGSYKKPFSNSYGCPKIQNMGFCPFKDKKRVKEVLQNKKSLNSTVVDIEECFKPKEVPAGCSPPSAACIAYYAKCNVSLKNKDYNPRSHFLNSHTQRDAKRARIEPPAGGTTLPCTDERKARIERVSKGQLPDLK